MISSYFGQLVTHLVTKDNIIIIMYTEYHSYFFSGNQKKTKNGGGKIFLKQIKRLYSVQPFMKILTL